MSAAETRVNKEITQICLPDATTGIIATLAPDDTPGKSPRHLRGTISGPEGTPYEGGRFEVDILIPKQYPFEPPKMKFETKVGWLFVCVELVICSGWHLVHRVSSTVSSLLIRSHTIRLIVNNSSITDMASECQFTDGSNLLGT